MPSITYTLASATTTPVVPVTTDMLRAAFMPPSVLCQISAGASLTYSIEVTGDDLQARGYTAANGLWVPMDSMAGLTASANGGLLSLVTGIRANCTLYASGSVKFQFVWASEQRT